MLIITPTFLEYVTNQVASIENVLSSWLLKSMGKDFAYKLINGTGFVASNFFNIVWRVIAPAFGISLGIIVHYLTAPVTPTHLYGALPDLFVGYINIGNIFIQEFLMASAT